MIAPLEKIDEITYESFPILSGTSLIDEIATLDAIDIAGQSVNINKQQLSSSDSLQLTEQEMQKKCRIEKSLQSSSIFN
jgi:hypothetical protein